MGKGGRVSEPHAANPRRSSGREGRFPSYPITGRRRHLPGLRGIELPRLRFSSISKRPRGSRGRGGSVRAAPARCQHSVPQSSSHSPSGTRFILFLISLFLYKRDSSVAPRLLYSLPSSTRTQWHRIPLGHRIRSKKNPLWALPQTIYHHGAPRA